MAKYKSCLHLHTQGDPEDNIKYSPEIAIQEAIKNGFEVLAITCHKKVIIPSHIPPEITVITSLEASIEGKDVIILNVGREAENIKTFTELANFKNTHPDCFILAPHPFYLTQICLGKKLIEHINLFDGIEWSYFYSDIINPNKKATKIAQKYNKPIIGTSDVHDLSQMDPTYCMIEAPDKSINSIIKAMKQNKVELVTKSFSTLGLFGLLWKLYKATK